MSQTETEEQLALIEEAERTAAILRVAIADSQRAAADFLRAAAELQRHLTPEPSPSLKDTLQ